jgi:cysteinyl-tRNA synthetase
MRIYNTLTRKIEEFVPISPPRVGMYVCGPTVYDYTHVGHMRTYTNSDVLRRVLTYLGFQVKLVMNITDVGHLTGDRDMGEDKLEKKAREESRDIWELARVYTEKFYETMAAINVSPPDIECKATDHIDEQIQLIRRLAEKGFTYRTSDGIYFDTLKWPDYGQLSHLDFAGMEEGARVEKNPEKKNATDFALWKFSPTDVTRQMQWESPWGVGFPGWHIECSAMSMKYLGEQFDLHTGGVDHVNVHHTNEIAQSEAATGKKPFVKYWFHSNFLLVNGEKMSKSKGNFYTLADFKDRQIDPLAARYWFLTGHYRSEMNFTWEAVAGAEIALSRLRSLVISFKEEVGRTSLSDEKLNKIEKFRGQFAAAVEEDLNMPEAMAIVWSVVKSNIPGPDKYDLLANFDEVLGLGLATSDKRQVTRIPEEIQELVNQRERLRTEGKFAEADKIRVELGELGYRIEDSEAGPVVKKK